MSDNKLLVIYNPVCGHGEAQAIFKDSVLPKLAAHGRTPDRIVATTHAGHAAEVVLEYLETAGDPLTIVLGSGDGTLHEILAALHTAPPSRPHNLAFALVPCGTANALYSSLFPPSATNTDAIQLSKTQALDAFLAGSARPLTLAHTALLGPAAQPTASSITAVVASTALHASILHDSEALRASHPGIERFKLAAQQNIARWYHARARLSVAPTAVARASITPVVELYDPAAHAFVPYAGPGRAPDGSSVDLDGPFVYFLSTVNADRLEPAFRIAPCQSTFPPLPASSPPTVDVVVVRPLRDPAVLGESDATRALFAEKAVAVLTAAYRNGAHVNLRYGSGGEIVEGGDGPLVVEYFKCNGWEWLPNPGDQYAHLVCVDGEILQIEPGGKAVSKAVNSLEGYTISVYS